MDSHCISAADGVSDDLTDQRCLFSAMQSAQLKTDAVEYAFNMQATSVER